MLGIVQLDLFLESPFIEDKQLEQTVYCDHVSFDGVNAINKKQRRSSGFSFKIIRFFMNGRNCQSVLIIIKLIIIT